MKRSAKKKSKSRGTQLELAYPPGRGGVRPGAGRKPKGEKAGVSHAGREEFHARYPVHVAMKVVDGLPSLRSRPMFRVVQQAILEARERLGMRVCEYSVQANHLHLIVEAEGKVALSRGMRGLAVRIAKGVQRIAGCAGRVLADRYFAHILRTPIEVKNALQYVLENARRHGWRAIMFDPCSSALWFDGWRHLVDVPPPPSPLARARSWLLRIGWRHGGLLKFGAVKVKQQPRPT